MPNPYLQQSANDIATNLTQNWQNNVLPSINSGAIAAGGYGGSRQGVAQANSINGLNQSIGQAQTSLYGNAYNTDQQLQAQRDMQAAQLASNQSIASMQDATQRYGLGNQYNVNLGQLGLGAQQLDLSNRVADQNFYTNQRGQDISQMGLGANLANQGNLGLGNQGQQLYQNGYQQQQAPYQALGQYAGLLSPFTGLNNSTTNSTPGYSGLQGALAGGLTMAQIIALLSGNKTQPGG